ncbi:enolase C-terminal domain-like protein [Acidisoma sp. 7E03]
MNIDPEYSVAYVILRTDQDGLSGHGLAFTIGRGTEIVCTAVRALAHLVIGLELDWIREDPGRFWRHLTNDSQLRWVGPDKGAMHLATGAVVNAVWDLWAKAVDKPIWRLVGEMTPAELVRCIDFRYITDFLGPEEALDFLTDAARGKHERLDDLLTHGYPCYTSAPGWLSSTDEQLTRAARFAVRSGFNHIKMKVGRRLEDDIRRLAIVREVIGPHRRLMIDANQVWEVDQAITWLKGLQFSNPWFIEEPTSPDDIEGHRKIRDAVAPIMVATGEMCQNRIMFKQFIQRGAIDIVQLDTSRLGGINEILAVMVMAARHDLPVCPHAGGVGLCEYVQHLAMFDYLAISCSFENRMAEYVDFLHEHFLEPCTVIGSAYLAPKRAGFSITMRPESLEQYTRRSWFR